MAWLEALLTGKDPGIRQDAMFQVTGPSPAGTAPASKKVENEAAEGDGTGSPVPTVGVSQAAPGEDLGLAAACAGPADSPARPLGWRQGSGEMG